MKLFHFINSHLEEIISEWEKFAQTLGPAADAMSDLALRDHAKGILQAIALDIGTRQNAAQQYEKSQGQPPEEVDLQSAAAIHGGLRQASDFSLLQLSAEYRALRATVIRLWLPRVGAMSESTVQEMVRFNEAIDQALAESVVTYSARADQTRELFLAILGHDLRAPLSTMLMAGEMLKREEVGRAQVAQIGARVRRSSLLMNHMVADLLGFTRTQLGKGMPIKPAPTDVAEVCHAAVEDAGATHPQALFDIFISGDLNGAFDQVRLHQLLTNLLVNAAQYGASERPVTLAASGDAERIIIEVSNYGAAIPAEALQLIFKPLVQLTPTESQDVRPRTSLGLGLFIAREIAVAHGGTIDVTSSAVEGTVFKVSLPRRTEPEHGRAG
ncbi:MAG: HAMP domain-containing sensor histidine kinase [Burkholderiaceae bacterium]